MYDSLDDVKGRHTILNYIHDENRGLFAFFERRGRHQPQKKANSPSVSEYALAGDPK